MILALDIGLAKLGYAIANRSNIVNYGVIKTKTAFPLKDRIKHIFDELNKLIKRKKVEVIATEKFFPHSLTSKNLSVLYIYGIILLLAAKNSIPVVSYNPKEIKRFITGYGNANKKQVEKMLRSIYNINLPKQKDTIDAISIALYHSHTSKCYRF